MWCHYEITAVFCPRSVPIGSAERSGKVPSLLHFNLLGKWAFQTTQYFPGKNSLDGLNTKGAGYLPAVAARIVCRVSITQFAGQGQAVGNGHQTYFNPGIRMDFAVEGPDRLGINIVDGMVGHITVPEHIVDGDQAAGP